ncbi:MAG TPA: transketolase [Candidatus Saccharimonadales bacterium]|nr:transketolase [Candidatus Saccharimonadales bacterium]
MNTVKLDKIAKKVREDILSMSFRAQSAHTGGALSCVEILVALYFDVMKVFPKNPQSGARDRLYFSKAHDAKALYAVLSERGFFSKKILEEYETNGGRLPGHSVRNCVPGVEISAGSLGHGLSMGCGAAYAPKLDRKKYRTFVILSDGECDEGTVWEAALFAGHHKLDNLVAIIDYNKLQGFGYTKNVLDLEPFAKKWQSFGWSAREINGNDFGQLLPLLKKLPFEKGKPTVIIAHTIKGLGGVQRHVNQISSQYKPPTKDDMKEFEKNRV